MFHRVITHGNIHIFRGINIDNHYNQPWVNEKLEIAVIGSHDSVAKAEVRENRNLKNQCYRCIYQ